MQLVTRRTMRSFKTFHWPRCSVCGTGGEAAAYIVGRVDGGERALEAAHFLPADIRVAVVSAKQTILAVLDSCEFVGF
jgi:hypothetical protein